MARTRSRVISILVTVDYVGGEPVMQRVHLRMLGYQKDIVIEDDLSVEDMKLMDAYEMLDRQEV